MYIDTNDVIANHNATIGNIDNNNLGKKNENLRVSYTANRKDTSY